MVSIFHAGFFLFEPKGTSPISPCFYVHPPLPPPRPTNPPSSGRGGGETLAAAWVPNPGYHRSRTARPEGFRFGWEVGWHGKSEWIRVAICRCYTQNTHTCVPSIVHPCLLSFWRMMSSLCAQCWTGTAKDKVTCWKRWIMPLNSSRRLMLAKAPRYMSCDTK